MGENVKRKLKKWSEKKEVEERTCDEWEEMEKGESVKGVKYRGKEEENNKWCAKRSEKKGNGFIENHITHSKEQLFRYSTGIYSHHFRPPLRPSQSCLYDVASLSFLLTLVRLLCHSSGFPLPLSPVCSRAMPALNHPLRSFFVSFS